MVKSILTVLCLFFVSTTYSSIVDVFEATNGHEPRVAINCNRVPFYIDLETGAWLADSDGAVSCDNDKEEVKRYCQKKYPKLNITNIVEANKGVMFKNWCEPGRVQCTDAKKVVPYRCLVNEYEADALMVPDGCKFDHLHDQKKCMTHDEWKKEAVGECKRKYSMKLRDYGILLSCKTDYFTGVEFVCCPKKSHKKHSKKTKVVKKVNRKALSAAIKKFQKYLPLETKGCDRSSYITKQTAMEEHHRNQIAAVVDEWDEAEKRYNKLKVTDPVAAEEKMKRTLEVFRQTLAALEQESKEEKARLRHEHADCINTQISKNKRDAMIAYLGAIEEKPVNAEKILKTVRKFIQVCEHDRVHSLRHFEHVRNRDPEKAETLRVELLQHLRNLNKVVNESMSLLNYLPSIAEQFGISGGAVLKPKLETPTDDHSEHDHDRVKEILESANEKYGEESVVPTKETKKAAKEDVPTEVKPTVELGKKSSDDDGDDDDEEEEDIGEYEKDVDTEPIETKSTTAAPKETKTMEKLIAADDGDNDDDSDNENFDYVIIEEAPKNKHHKRHHKHHHHKHHRHHTRGHVKELGADKVVKDVKRHGVKPVALYVVIGLTGVVLLIVLLLVVVLAVRRRRMTPTRVVLAENNDEREHLVEMQKNGFENPTYKFFYY